MKVPIWPLNTFINNFLAFISHFSLLPFACSSSTQLQHFFWFFSIFRLFLSLLASCSYFSLFFLVFSLGTIVFFNYNFLFAQILPLASRFLLLLVPIQTHLEKKCITKKIRKENYWNTKKKSAEKEKKKNNNNVEKKWKNRTTTTKEKTQKGETKTWKEKETKQNCNKDEQIRNKD